MAAAATADPIVAEKAFDSLSRLVGDWEATTAKGGTVRISLKLVSSGSALVETYTTPSGKETLTIFHRDGAHLLATHYCGQGNQPRLRLASPSAASPSRFVFQFADATNLPDPSASHLTELALDVQDPDHFATSETYEEAGKPDLTVLSFRRTR